MFDESETKKKDDNKCGLWVKERDEDGKIIKMSGKYKEQLVMIFLNQYKKEEDKRPDYNLVFYPSKNKKEENAPF